jgi:hypothetical protein
MLWQRKTIFRKTEMWYIMQADEEGIIVGLKKILTQRIFRKLKANYL